MSNANNAAVNLSAHLVSLGWADPVAASRQCRTVSIARTLMVEPSRKALGAPIALSAALPAGARITIGEESGVVEHSPRGNGYVRLAASQDFDRSDALIRDLVEAGATITLP